MQRDVPFILCQGRFCTLRLIKIVGTKRPERSGNLTGSEAPPSAGSTIFALDAPAREILAPVVIAARGGHYRSPPESTPRRATRERPAPRVNGPRAPDAHCPTRERAMPMARSLDPSHGRHWPCITGSPVAPAASERRMRAKIVTARRQPTQKMFAVGPMTIHAAVALVAGPA